MNIRDILMDILGETVCYEMKKGGEKGCFKLDVTFLGNLPVFFLDRHGFVSKDVESVTVREGGIPKITFYGPSFHQEEY